MHFTRLQITPHPYLASLLNVQLLGGDVTQEDNKEGDESKRLNGHIIPDKIQLSSDHIPNFLSHPHSVFYLLSVVYAICHETGQSIFCVHSSLFGSTQHSIDTGHTLPIHTCSGFVVISEVYQHQVMQISFLIINL